MAKKSMIEREKKRNRLVAKYAAKRAELKEEFEKATSLQDKNGREGLTTVIYL